MGTLKRQIFDPSDIVSTNVVKVVTNLLGDAIYFSRCPIPYERDGRSQTPLYFKHIGLYVYRREFLVHYPDLTVGPLEQAERLEQLRALENGYRIRVVQTEYESIGVDTPEDLERVNKLFSVSAKGADAPRETEEELARPAGEVLDTPVVLRGFPRNESFKSG
jgi:3-deoxy-manno-octulosonate cytidylyltransferase (CMP-KDO synthetase)